MLQAGAGIEVPSSSSRQGSTGGWGGMLHQGWLMWWAAVFRHTCATVPLQAATCSLAGAAVPHGHPAAEPVPVPGLALPQPLLAKSTLTFSVSLRGRHGGTHQAAPGTAGGFGTIIQAGSAP